MPAYFDIRSVCENCGLEYADKDQIKRFTDPAQIKRGSPYNNKRAEPFNRHLKKVCPRCFEPAVIEFNTIVAGVHKAEGVPSQDEVIAEEEARVARLKQMGIEDKENKGIDPETGLEV